MSRRLIWKIVVNLPHEKDEHAVNFIFCLLCDISLFKLHLILCKQITEKEKMNIKQNEKGKFSYT